MQIKCCSLPALPATLRPGHASWHADIPCQAWATRELDQTPMYDLAIRQYELQPV